VVKLEAGHAVTGEAKATSLKSVVIGGLPDGGCSFLPGGSTPKKPEGDDYDEMPPLNLRAANFVTTKAQNEK
jgi:hypothetical protein